MKQKHLDLELEMAVLEQCGKVFDGQEYSHLFDHAIGIEIDHHSSLIRRIVKSFLKIRLKTYGRNYTKIVAHKNEPSSRHELTKLVLFKNQ